MSELKKEKRGGICFYCCDNIEFMKTKPDNYYDLAIVDPPYGIGENGQRNLTGDRPTAKWNNPQSVNYKPFDDSKPPPPEYWKELFRISKNQIVWGGNYFSEYLPPKSGWIVWNKKADIKEHLSMAELAWTSFDKKCNMFDYLWAGFKKKHQIKRIHPTQKPVDLYRFCLLNYAENGMKILDTHGGSMSLAKACDIENFDLDICEIDKDHFSNGLNEYDEYKRQHKLF